MPLGLQDDLGIINKASTEQPTSKLGLKDDLGIMTKDDTFNNYPKGKRQGLTDMFAKGAAIGLGGYGAVKVAQKLSPAVTKGAEAIASKVGDVGNAVGKTVQALPQAVSYKQGAAFAKDVQKSFVQAHTNKVKQFGENLDKLSTDNPERAVSLKGLVTEINSDPDISPEARRIFEKTPHLKEMLTRPDLAENVTLRETQDILNHINTKIPKNITVNNLDVLDLKNNIRSAQLDAFPEMAQVKQDYASFIAPYKNVKGYFGFNKTLNAIKNKFGGPQGQEAVEAILPKEVISRMGGYRRAANTLDMITHPIGALMGKFLGVAPMLLDAGTYSQDPMGYLFEQETGRPKAELHQAKATLEKMNSQKQVSKEEVAQLVSLGLVL